MRAFLDASAWVARALPRDQWAADFHRILEEMREAPTFVTTNWTLYEGLAVVKRRNPPAVGVLHRDAIRHAEILMVDADTEAEALRRFLEWTDKSASVVDHANVLVADRARCEAVISFDEDFVPLAASAGLRLLR